MRDWRGPLATTFICLAFCAAGLQPGVSLQDAGELATAVHSWGIPHPPGYPLFVLFGRLFSLLPFSEFVYRTNLMSAVFTALAGGALHFAIRDWLRRVAKARPVEILASAGALIAVLSRSSFRQAVITEVYALNSLLIALMLVCLTRIYLSARELDWKNQRRYLLSFSLLLGLALSNHHTSWCFAVMALIFGSTFSPNVITRFRFWPMAFFALAIGLLPYLYLPLASAAEPALNWGDPETWRRFWQHVTRFQYDPRLYRSWPMAIEQMREQALLLLEDQALPVILLGFFGLVSLFESDRPLFSLALAGLIFTGPVTALLTNFAYNFQDRTHYEEARYLVSVFFIPHGFFWGFLAAVGSSAILMRLHAKWWRTVSLALFFAALFSSWLSFRTESKREERAADSMFNNWERHIGREPAVVIANWDPFYFPALYFQLVDQRMPRLILLDIELMKLPWYLQSLEKQYPALMRKVAPEVHAYLEVMHGYFDGTAHDPREGMRRYVALLNAVIDRAYAEMPVYLALQRSQRLLPAGVAETYRIDPEWILGRLRQPDERPARGRADVFEFSGFAGPTMRNDFVLRSVAIYHVQLLLETALLAKQDDPTSARVALGHARDLARRLEHPANLFAEIERTAQLLDPANDR